MKTTFGLLYPGEMGAALGRLLAKQGHGVVTTLAGRGPRTVSLAAAAGFEVLGSLYEVVEVSDVILSLVPPSAAQTIARRVADCARTKANAIYVDANSISPETVQAVAIEVEEAGMSFVDGAIQGQAARLPEHGVAYLSGADALHVADLLEGVVATRWLGEEPGRASAMKMLISGMAKGLTSLFVEMALAARQASLLEEFLANFSEAYPGLMAPVSRILPTYPRHAARRAEEISELETTIRGLGLEPQLVPGMLRLTTHLARSDLHRYAQAIDDGLFEIDDLIELIALDNPLKSVAGDERRECHHEYVEAKT